MAKRFIYSEEQLKFLRVNYPLMGLVELTTLFNTEFKLSKSKETIKTTMTNHNIKCGRGTGELTKGRLKLFTNEQKKWFEEHYPLNTRSQLTIKFNQVFNQQKTEEQVIAFLKNHKIKSGKTGYFLKGSKSWNTGTKGIMKKNSGSFKKGRTPENWVPIGTERTVKGGYIEIKTAEPHTWTQKHRIIFEEAYGPIPENHNIRFKDGDPANIDPSNLVMVNKSEHHILTQLNLKDQADEHKDTVILIARVKSKAIRMMNRE